jgi:hypothetical protein
MPVDANGYFTVPTTIVALVYPVILSSPVVAPSMSIVLILCPTSPATKYAADEVTITVVAFVKAEAGRLIVVAVGLVVASKAS